MFQLLAIPVYAFLANRVDLRWILMLGLALFGISMWDFSSITHDWGGKELLLPQAIRGFAQQMAVPPTVTLTLGALSPARLKLASGLFNLMRNLGGALGIAACATVLNDRTNLHFLRLAEHLNVQNETMNTWLEQWSSNAQALGQDSLDASHTALRQLWALTWREAQTLTYADAFLVIMVCFALATVLVPLMRKVQPRHSLPPTPIDPSRSALFFPSSAGLVIGPAIFYNLTNHAYSWQSTQCPVPASGWCCCYYAAIGCIAGSSRG